MLRLEEVLRLAWILNEWSSARVLDFPILLLSLSADSTMRPISHSYHESWSWVWEKHYLVVGGRLRSAHKLKYLLIRYKYNNPQHNRYNFCLAWIEYLDWYSHCHLLASIPISREGRRQRNYKLVILINKRAALLHTTWCVGCIGRSMCKTYSTRLITHKVHIWS
jgi:hypothetical protein